MGRKFITWTFVKFPVFKTFHCWSRIYDTNRKRKQELLELAICETTIRPPVQTPFCITRRTVYLGGAHFEGVSDLHPRHRWENPDANGTLTTCTITNDGCNRTSIYVTEDILAYCNFLLPAKLFKELVLLIII